MLRRYRGGELVAVDWGFLTCQGEVVEASRTMLRVRIHEPYTGIYTNVRPWQVRRLQPGETLTPKYAPRAYSSRHYRWGA